MEQKDRTVSYWKHPWYKWAILIVGLLELWLGWHNLHECWQVVASGIFSEAALESYLSGEYFDCTLNGMLGATFLTQFFTGIFARDQRQAKLSDGFSILVLGLILGGLGLVFRWFQPVWQGILWGALLLFMLLGGGYYAWKYRKKD